MSGGDLCWGCECSASVAAAAAPCWKPSKSAASPALLGHCWTAVALNYLKHARMDHLGGGCPWVIKALLASCYCAVLTQQG